MCPICFETLKDPYIIPECTHRFCHGCITKALDTSGNECPFCRGRVTSRRALRKDELVGNLIREMNED